MAMACVSDPSTSTPFRGRWVRNTMYQSKLVNNNQNRIFDDFAESVQYPRIDLDQITWAARKAQYSWRQSARTIPEPTTKKCLLTQLPNEVLIHIMRYLIPYDQSFHIFDYENEYRRRSTMIHRFCKPISDIREADPIAGNIQPHITALATVCRRLSDIFHTVMYGDNRFIFELGMSTVWPRPIAKSQTSLCNVESWARIYEAIHECLWPLTARTSVYVKDVTILVTKSYQELNKYERLILIEHLSHVNRLFNCSQNLASFTVDMSTPAGPHESVSQRLGWKNSGEGDHILKLREVIRCPPKCEDCGGFDSLWELLKDIRCKNDVVLSGHIRSELADEMRGAMIAE